jgi:hypothetical protein
MLECGEKMWFGGVIISYKAADKTHELVYEEHQYLEDVDLEFVDKGIEVKPHQFKNTQLDWLDLIQYGYSELCTSSIDDMSPGLP